MRSTKRAVAIYKVAIDLGRDLAGIEQAGTVYRSDFAIAGQPAERICIQLIAGVIAITSAADLFHDAVALEGKEQKPNDLIHLRRPRLCPLGRYGTRERLR